MNDLLAVNEEAKRNGQKLHCRATVKRMLLRMFSLRISLPLSGSVMKSKQPHQYRTTYSWGGCVKNLLNPSGVLTPCKVVFTVFDDRDWKIVALSVKLSG